MYFNLDFSKEVKNLSFLKINKLLYGIGCLKLIKILVSLVCCLH